jgi:hypothetical protein
MNYKDIVKDWITDGIGLTLWVIAIVMITNKGIAFWPDFVGIMVVGGVFFLIPDETIASWLRSLVKKKLDKE